MRIAVAGDMHYPELPEENQHLKSIRNEFYLNYCRRFFSIDADLYVSIGDLTNFGTKRELKEIYHVIGQFEKPFIHVLGNHDVYGNKRETVLNITDQKRYHAISTDVCDLAFIDTTRDQNTERWDGTVDGEQLSWLSEVVEQSGTRPLLVFGHHPLKNTTAYSNQAYSSINQDVPLWEVLQRKEGIGMYVNGHNHFYSFAERDQWIFTQLACILDHQAVRIIDIEKQKIDCKTINVSNETMKRQAQLLGNAIEHFRLATSCLSSNNDLSRTIPLYQHAL